MLRKLSDDLQADLQAALPVNVDQWALHLRALAEPGVTTVARPDGGTVRIESHACAWAYAPVIGDGGEEHRLWACQRHWSDGMPCSSRSADPNTMAEACRAFEQPPPLMSECTTCGCRYHDHLIGGRCAGDFLACKCEGFTAA